MSGVGRLRSDLPHMIKRAKLLSHPTIYIRDKHLHWYVLFLGLKKNSPTKIKIYLFTQTLDWGLFLKEIKFNSEQ